MPYPWEIRKSVNKRLKKLDKSEKDNVMKKIQQICENPTHYKPLRRPMDGYREAHVNTSFVLVFSFDPVEKKVIIEDYDHHDKVYK